MNCQMPCRIIPINLFDFFFFFCEFELYERNPFCIIILIISSRCEWSFDICIFFEKKKQIQTSFGLLNRYFYKDNYSKSADHDVRKWHDPLESWHIDDREYFDEPHHISHQTIKWNFAFSHLIIELFGRHMVKNRLFGEWNVRMVNCTHISCAQPEISFFLHADDFKVKTRAHKKKPISSRFVKTKSKLNCDWRL